MSVLVTDLIANTMKEIGALAPGEPPTSDEQTDILGKLNRLLDRWNTQRLYTFNVNFVNYTLTANLSPHTIGPTGTFTVSVRPVEIKAAAIILNNVTPNVTSPVTLRDDDWWANQRVKSLAASLPTDLYYSPDFPNGSLFLWPVPSTAYGLELETRTILASVVIGDTITLPPGYEDAITLSLAEDICPMFEKSPNPVLLSAAMRARSAIKATNSFSPRISTVEAGMPRGGGVQSDWNYRTGRIGRG